MREDAIEIRRAVPDDARQISSLYVTAYASVEAGEINRYPFPQFFDHEWVAQAVSLEWIYWVVAECHGEVIATGGSVRNIGSQQDRIAEGFGLVVEPAYRGRGIAHKLFRFLTELLIPETCFIIGEARTVHAGGWRVLRAGGYVPIGFEPFAHMMPAGVESMLLTGLVPQHRSQQRAAGIRVTEQVHRLARLVLPMLDLPTNDIGIATPQPDVGLALALPSRLHAPDPTELPPTLELVRDDVAGKRMLDACPICERHASGVIGLNRLEGLEKQGARFERQFFIARTKKQELSCVRVAWDGLDRRSRILDLRTRQHSIVCEALRETCRQISIGAGPEPLTVSVDVRSDAIELQTTLEELGFHVTAYYPGLIANGEQRIDAIQYTCCVGRSLSDGWQNVDRLDWQQALAVATMVVGTPQQTTLHTNCSA